MSPEISEIASSLKFPKQAALSIAKWVFSRNLKPDFSFVEEGDFLKPLREDWKLVPVKSKRQYLMQFCSIFPDLKINVSEDDETVDDDFNHTYPFVLVSMVRDSKRYNGEVAVRVSILLHNYCSQLTGSNHSHEFAVSVENIELSATLCFCLRKAAELRDLLQYIKGFISEPQLLAKLQPLKAVPGEIEANYILPLIGQLSEIERKLKSNQALEPDSVLSRASVAFLRLNVFLETLEMVSGDYVANQNYSIFRVIPKSWINGYPYLSGELPFLFTKQLFDTIRCLFKDGMSASLDKDWGVKTFAIMQTPF